MARIYLCFLWHMHQPFYKDLITGEYKMPWTRLHALKDYYGMVQVLGEFPAVRQTFNLVPSLMVQVEEYAAGKAFDPLLRLALKPAESLTEREQETILLNFFAGNPQGIIYRYARYGELFEAWRAADKNAARARRYFGVQAFRDLQVLSQLAWFDEEFVARDPEIRDLVAKGRDYSLEDQQLIARKELEIIGAVPEVYRKFAATGQIEISTTPFYHPILPLLCDSDIAAVSHPRVPLPTRFRYPQDARCQLERARDFIGKRFGTTPAGVWPSEGSVSDEVLGIAADLGFRWIATDNGVLARTIGHMAGPGETYRLYRWRQGGREIGVLFRDHTLSDLIGFVYARMGAQQAAKDFLDRIRDNCRPILASGRDALVPIILDGENAWEYYDHNGRPFLRELYKRISDDPGISAVTIQEGLKHVEPHSLDRIFPGSWINANFDVWIGAEEDNKAWEFLLRARQTYQRFAETPEGAAIPAGKKELAREELLISEGSDWCWWYGPEHASDYKAEFDQLYRDHLANIYQALGQTPPQELSQPILKLAAPVLHVLPTGTIQPRIDGKVSSYFEWLGAGHYRIDPRSGSMHGKSAIIRDIYYGTDGANLYLRLDFTPELQRGMELRIAIRKAGDPAQETNLSVRFGSGSLTSRRMTRGNTATEPSGLEYANIFEAALPIESIGIEPGSVLDVRLSIWNGELPVDAVPQDGWIQISTVEPAEWPV